MNFCRRQNGKIIERWGKLLYYLHFLLLLSDKTIKAHNTLDVVACTVPLAGGRVQ